MSTFLHHLVVAGLAATVIACAGSRNNGGAASAAGAAAEPVARAQLVDSSGAQVGAATFTPGGDGVQIAVRASGLTPGEHGIHLHEKGSCQPPDFESAGGHFNPTKKHHGLDHPDGPHAGDMRNLTVGSDGTVSATLTATDATLDDAVTSILSGGSRTLVIHAEADDQRSDPSGESGARVACGVVTPI